MTLFILAYLVTAAAYVGLAGYFWRTRWSGVPDPAIQRAGRSDWEQAAVLAPLGLQQDSNLLEFLATLDGRPAN